MMTQLAGKHHDHLDGLQGRHGRDARMTVDERQLSQQVTRVADAEDQFVAIVVQARDLHAPGQDDHDAVVRLVLVYEHGSAREAAPKPDLQQRPDLAHQAQVDLVVVPVAVGGAPRGQQPVLLVVPKRAGAGTGALRELTNAHARNGKP